MAVHQNIFIFHSLTLNELISLVKVQMKRVIHSVFCWNYFSNNELANVWVYICFILNVLFSIWQERIAEISFCLRISDFITEMISPRNNPPQPNPACQMQFMFQSFFGAQQTRGDCWMTEDGAFGYDCVYIKLKKNNKQRAIDMRIKKRVEQFYQKRGKTKKIFFFSGFKYRKNIPLDQQKKIYFLFSTKKITDLSPIFPFQNFITLSSFDLLFYFLAKHHFLHHLSQTQSSFQELLLAQFNKASNFMKNFHFFISDLFFITLYSDWHDGNLMEQGP